MSARQLANRLKRIEDRSKAASVEIAPGPRGSAEWEAAEIDAKARRVILICPEAAAL